MACHFCGVAGTWPAVCANTRDMEDFAIFGVDSLRGERCFAVLEKNEGLGEKGLRYVIANRAAQRREKAEAESSVSPQGAEK